MAPAHNSNGKDKQPVTLDSLRGFEKTPLSKFLTPKETTDDAGSDSHDGNSGSGEGVSGTVATATGSQSTDAKAPADSTSEPKVEDKPVESDQVFDVKGQKVPLKDLLNAFETREQISRRFDEIGKREQKLKAAQEDIKKAQDELAFINLKFAEMQGEIKKGNPLNALSIALTMANAGEGSANPEVIDLIKQAQTIAENFAAMDEDEQKVFIEKQQLERREQALKRQEERTKAKEEELALSGYYNNLLDEHKVTDAELDVAYEDIQKLDKYREELDKKSSAKEKINYCLSWVLGKRWNSMIGDAIESVDPKLAKDTNFRLALIEDLDPNCTKDDVVKIVKDYVQQNSTEDSAKVESGASTQSVESKPSTTSDRAPTEKTTAEKQTAPITDFKQIIAKYSAR